MIDMRSIARTGATLAILTALAGIAVPRGAVQAQSATLHARGIAHTITTAHHPVRPAFPPRQAGPATRAHDVVHGEGHPANRSKVKGAIARPGTAQMAHVPMPRVPLLHPGITLPTAGRAVVSAIHPATPTTFLVNGPCAGAPPVTTAETTLQNALTAAHNGDTIDICPGTYPVEGASLIIPGAYQVGQSTLTIQGLGATPAGVVFNAASPPSSVQRQAVFIITGTGDTLSNLTVENAVATSPLVGFGVIVTSPGTTLTDLALTNNEVGAYVVSGGGATLKGVTESSTASNQEAGLWVDGAPVTVQDDAAGNHSSFSANTTGEGIGAYVNNGGTLTVTNAIFNGNTGSLGAGIAAPSGSTANVALTGGTANANTDFGVALQGGGALSSNGTKFDGNFDGVYVTADAADGTSTVSLTGGEANANKFAGVLINSLTATTCDINGLTANANGSTGAPVAGGFGIAYGFRNSPITGAAVNPSGPTGGLVNVVANGNQSSGFYDGVPGSVIISNSVFNSNLAVAPQPNAGIYIGTAVNGSVVLNTVTANNNSGDGLDFLGAGPLTINTGTFATNTGTNDLGNPSTGIDVYSTNAAVTLNNVTASGNASSGLFDESNGLHTISGGTYNNNGDSGIYFLPITVAPFGVNTPVVFSNVTANANAGSGFEYFESGTGTVTGSGTNTFNGNGADGIWLHGGGTGATSLSGITANNNVGNGLNDANGGALNVSGTNSFTSNGNDGVNLQGVGSAADTLSGVTANGNAIDGLDDATDGALSVSASTFGAGSGTGNGLFGIHDYGAPASITLVNTNASWNADEGLLVDGATSGAISVTGTGHFDHNGSGCASGCSGIFLDTVVAASPGTNPVTIGDATSTLTATGNTGDGVYILTNGTNSIANLTANGNAFNGLEIGQSTTSPQSASGATTVNNSTFGATGAGNGTTGQTEDVGGNGILIGGATIAGLTLTNVTSNYNVNDGLANFAAMTGSNSITIGTSHFDYNLLYGFGDYGVGPLNVSGTSASARTTFDNNGEGGLYVDEPGSAAMVQVPVTLNYVEANGNGFAVILIGGAGVELGNEDSISAQNSAFNNNFSTGVSVFTGNTVAAVTDTFANDTFNGNASTGTSSGNDNAGLALDNSDTITVNLTTSTLNGNGTNGNGGSGLFVYDGPGTDSVTIQGNTIQGNNPAQGLNTVSAFGGITLYPSFTTPPGQVPINIDTRPAPSGPYNHINGNGVGIVIENPLTGYLSANDITGNMAAGIAIFGNPSLTGLTASVSNSIYGGAFTAVPTPSGDPGTLSKAAQPSTPPYYGYVNFGTGSGLNLAGNWFGIGGVFGSGHFPAGYAAPSVLAAPTPTPASYYDIGGNYRNTGSFITLKVSAPATTLIPLVPAQILVTATLNDGNGNNVLDGTPVNLYLFNGTTLLGMTHATTSGGVASGTISLTAPLNPTGHSIALAVVATAPDRGVADTTTSVSELPGSTRCWVTAKLLQSGLGTLQVVAMGAIRGSNLLTYNNPATGTFTYASVTNLVVSCVPTPWTNNQAVLSLVLDPHQGSHASGMFKLGDHLLIYLGNQNGHPYGQIVDVTNSAFTVSFNQPAAGSSVAIHGT